MAIFINWGAAAVGSRQVTQNAVFPALRRIGRRRVNAGLPDWRQYGRASSSGTLQTRGGRQCALSIGSGSSGEIPAQAKLRSCFVQFGLSKEELMLWVGVWVEPDDDLRFFD